MNEPMTEFSGLMILIYVGCGISLLAFAVGKIECLITEILERLKKLEDEK